MRVKVYKLYSTGELKKALDAEYNGSYAYLFDFIKENLQIRKVGEFFVHLIMKNREFLMLFRDAEFDFGKAKVYLYDDEIDALRKILEADAE